MSHLDSLGPESSKKQKKILLIFEGRFFITLASLYKDKFLVGVPSKVMVVWDVWLIRLVKVVGPVRAVKVVWLAMLVRVVKVVELVHEDGLLDWPLWT